MKIKGIWKQKYVGLPSPGSFFSITLGRSEFFFFNHFEMEKIALIFIYNIFVTKKNYFQE